MNTSPDAFKPAASSIWQQERG